MPRSVVLAVLVALLLPVQPDGTDLHQVYAKGGAQVSIIDFAFQLDSLVIKRGRGVTWTNTGAKPHTVTSDSGLFDSGTLTPGTTFTRAFKQSGTFAYHCSIHPSMTGVIKVKRDHRHH